MSLFSSTEETVGRAAGGGPTPIFIVGMPRSGTTLMESVLSAHSRVRGGGERPQMQQILDACLRLADAGSFPGCGAAVLGEWRDAYFAEVRLTGTADHLTDKHPLNFEGAGLIARLFPAAVIIHIRRNPLETAVSIYRNEFSKFWTFTDRFEDIGHFYGQYARLVSHWERVLGRRFLTIQYEEFAGDFDRAARELVAACGLQWEDPCRNFQSVQRAIPTFSAVQAREAVCVRTGGADRYRPYLGPLINALNDAGVDLSTGELRSHGARR